ncbi:MAG: hypothetical protein KAI66_11270 [Lentisphaeria bacterium]|nr:hypothetical protein [Lentisphaeria bacterium]
MKTLGTICGITTLVLAIAAAGLSWVISARRAEFRGRADKLASSVADMMTKIDADSGTAVKDKVNFTPGERASKTMEKGSLGWQAYHGAKDAEGDYAAFQTTVDLAKKHVADLVQQRDSLSETLASMGSALELPSDVVDPSDLQNLDDPGKFTKAASTMAGHASAVANRDKALVSSISKAAEEIGHALEIGKLTARETTTDVDGNEVLSGYPCRDILTEFNFHVTGMKNRSDHYAQTLTDAIDHISTHEWQVDRDKIGDEEGYNGALTSMVNDFDDINGKLEKYERAKIQIKVQKTKIGLLEVEVDEMRENVEKAQDQLAKTRVMLEDAMRKLPGGISNLPGGSLVNLVERDIEGKVVEVNSHWNYVILDLGSRDALRKGTEMLVKRDGRLVAKIEVTAVRTSNSIAEILPEAMVSTVKLDDEVIMPMMQD